MAETEVLDAPVVHGERRRNDRAIVEAIHRLGEDLNSRHGENVTRQTATAQKLDQLVSTVAELAKGFPNNDPDGHRVYHEAVIRKLEARTKFYEDLRSELAKRGVVVVLGLIALACWQYFKTKVNA